MPDRATLPPLLCWGAVIAPGGNKAELSHIRPAGWHRGRRAEAQRAVLGEVAAERSYRHEVHKRLYTVVSPRRFQLLVAAGGWRHSHGGPARPPRDAARAPEHVRMLEGFRDAVRPTPAAD